MAQPLRKDPMQEDLTTADLAKAQSLNSETRERKPLLVRDNPENAAGSIQQIPVKVEKTTNEVRSTGSIDRTLEGQSLSSATDRSEDQLTDHDNEDLLTESTTQRVNEAMRIPARRGDPITEQRRSIQPDSTPLFPGSELEELRSRWKEVQTAFVDEPRSAVEQADCLVASAMKRLAEVFADEHAKLEKQWDSGDNVSTEDLRLALRRYRIFFQRLLAV